MSQLQNIKLGGNDINNLNNQNPIWLKYIQILSQSNIQNESQNNNNIGNPVGFNSNLNDINSVNNNNFLSLIEQAQKNPNLINLIKNLNNNDNNHPLNSQSQHNSNIINGLLNSNLLNNQNLILPLNNNINNTPNINFVRKIYFLICFFIS